MPPQLPVEIIHSELLPRLPAKSIGRLRCVCKAWNTLLSTHDFARMHLRYQTNHKLIILGQLGRTFSTLDCGPPLNHDSIITTRFIPFNEEVLILGSLDGMVCVALMKTRELAFWNPLTRAYKKINCTSRLFDDGIRYGAFAFCINSSNDYKLVHIVSDGGFIYSWRLDSWRKINNTCLEISNYTSSYTWVMATFACNKVYFKLIGSGGLPWRVISFDVEYEKFEEIHLPQLLCECLGVNLVAINGCIHLYVGCLDVLWNFKADMWRKVGDGWVKVAAFSNPNPPNKWYVCREIHTKRNGNWVAVWKDNNCVKNVGLEDLVTDFFYLIFGDLWHKAKGTIYNETLVSPIPH